MKLTNKGQRKSLLANQSWPESFDVDNKFLPREMCNVVMWLPKNADSTVVDNNYY